MVFIGSDFDKMDFVPQRNVQTDVFQRLGSFFREHIPTVFDWGDDVVQQQRLVMTLFNVLAHPYILPRSKLTGKCFDYKPSHSKEDKYYYKMPDFWGHYISFLMTKKRIEKLEGAIKIMASIAKEKNVQDAENIAGFNARRDDVIWGMGIMGRFNLSYGEDEKGSYISYY